MPRKPGVSGRSTTRFIFLSPSARTITLCFSGVQMTLRINLILMVPAMALAYLSRVETAQGGHFAAVAQLLESVDGRFHHVVRVVRADRFGQHVRNAHRGDDGA